MKALEQVLADWRGEAAVLRRRGHMAQAEAIEQLCTEVAEASHEYVAWLSEAEAELRSGHQIPWFRARFSEWEREGHARREHGRRLYRMLIVPRRADTAAAREAGRRAAREDAA